MKKTWKRILATLLVLAMALSLTACMDKSGESPNSTPEEKAENAQNSPEAAEADDTPKETAAETTATETQAEKKENDAPVVIGVALKTLASEYWQYVKNGLEAGAAEAGAEIIVVGPPSESDITGQVALIEDLVSQGVDAICVAPNQPDSVGPVLQTAKDKGILVFFIDTDAPFEGKTALFGPGNEPAAELGGNYAAERLPEGSKAVIIRGRLGDPVHDERVAGFSAPLEAKGIEVLDVQPADSSADRAMAVMEDFMQKYEKIDVVLTCNDEMAQGAARAAVQSGQKDITFIGFGGNQFMMEPIRNGEIAATISINPYNMGKTSAIEITKAVRGGSIDSFVDTGASLIDKDNCDDYEKSLADMIKGN